MAKSKRTTKSFLPNRPIVEEPTKPPISPMVIGAVVAVILVLVGGFIIFSQGKIATGRSGPVDPATFPMKGKANAPVTITGFSDFGCSHCRDFALDKFSLLDKEYIETGKVKFVAHPFYFGNPAMGLASQAAWCTAEQNKYFEYSDVLFKNYGTNFNEDILTDLAAQVPGLNANAVRQCLTAGTYRDKLEEAYQMAVMKGIQSTPTFFVNQQRIEGNQAIEKFREVIEQELAKSK